MKNTIRLAKGAAALLAALIAFAPTASADELWVGTHRSVTVVEDGKDPVAIGVDGIVAGIAFAGDRVLVANDQGLAVVDAKGRKLEKFLRMAPDKGRGPRFEAAVQAVAASADGDTAYASVRLTVEGNKKGPALIKVVDLSGAEMPVTATIPMPDAVEEVSAIFPVDGDKLYCFRRLDLAFSVVDVAARKVVSEIDLKTAQSILWDREVREILPVHSQGLIYVPMFEGDADAARLVVAVIDTDKGTVKRHDFGLDQTAQCAATSPDGALLYIASRRLLVVDADDLSTGGIKGNIEHETLTSDLVVSSDGKKLWAVDGSKTLHAFDTEKLKPTGSIELPSRARWIELRPTK